MSQKMHKRFCCVPLVIFCLMTIGCGRSGPELAPVTGILLMDGKPVDKAGVLFSPIAGGAAASGTTDDAGVFRLKTGNLKGALLGEHTVAVTKSESIGVSSEEDGLSGAMLGRGWKLVNHLPVKYGSPTTSGLKAVVKDKENQFEFKLESK